MEENAGGGRNKRGGEAVGVYHHAHCLTAALCVHSKKNGICVRLATAAGLSATDKGIDHDGQHQHDTFDDQLYGGWLIE